MQDVQDLYDKRIKSLVSNYIQISVPSSIKFKEEETLDGITTGIHTLKTLISRGFVDIGNIFNDSTKHNYDDALYNAIWQLDTNNMSTNTLLSILNYGVVNSLLLMSTEVAILTDD